MACGAIIRSHKWATLSDEERDKIFSLILRASKERTYLGILSYQFIVISLQKVSKLF